MSRNTMLMLFTLLVAVLVILAATGMNVVLLRALLALPLVLVVPGYLCTMAAFPHRVHFAERWLLSIGLSLVVVVLGGLVLHLTPWGLTSTAWAVYLSVVVVISGGIAWWRRRRTGRSASGVRQFTRLTTQSSVMLGVSGLIIVAAFMVARVGAENQPVSRFTQFWLLPSKQQDENRVRLGVANQETQTMMYRVELLVAGSAVTEWPVVQVEQGAQWQIDATLPVAQQQNEVVTARLYRLDEPNSVYRQVKIWRTSGKE